MNRNKHTQYSFRVSSYLIGVEGVFFCCSIQLRLRVMEPQPCRAALNALSTAFETSGCDGSAYLPQLRSFVRCMRSGGAPAREFPGSSSRQSDCDTRTSDACSLETLRLHACLANGGCDPSQCWTPFDALLRWGEGRGVLRVQSTS